MLSRNPYTTRLPPRRGVPPSVTQEQLGHVTATMTNEVYTHAAPYAREVAAAAIDAAWAGEEAEEARR